MTTGYRAAALPTADGWTEVIDDGFIALVGPFYTRTDGTYTEVAVVCQDKHRNRRGVVQGGLVMKFADRVLRISARAHSGAPTTATVHLDVHFVAPVHVGDVLRARPRGLLRFGRPRTHPSPSGR
ncbi:PaaI family thioesterase [Rhodococcus sp. USK13]|uniref:PaaI family thioesterase n=1 Tax=Rhodococcus sp. USK13 TaxID=2806442 RepID=UPI001BCC5922|nr:PaaI family thioesterase [Rhodococcus sp. USK13]